MTRPVPGDDDPTRKSAHDVLWPADWLQCARQTRRDLWRGVEAQHQVATMRLVDTAREQELLEDLLEAAKPPVPREARDSHYLVFTPFRYTSPHPSRFRRAHAPGIWYGADEPATVCAELAWWRWRFLRDSEGLREHSVITEHTLFKARFAGFELDLTRAPWNALRHHWRDPLDYATCHALTDALRGGAIQVDAIRYESARREGARCAAVLRPGALSIPSLQVQQTWVCKVSPGTVLFSSKSGNATLSFDFSAQAPAA